MKLWGWTTIRQALSKHWRDWGSLFLALWASFMIFLAALVGFQYFVPLAWWSGSSAAQYVAIPYGTSTVQIANRLVHDEVIRSAFWFRFYARVLGYDRQIKAGFFQLNGRMSLRRVLAKVGRRNDSGSLVRVTFPEGVPVTQMGKILQARGLMDAGEFVGFVRKAKPIFIQRYPFLRVAPSDSLEGFLFPDTYFIANGSDPSMIVDMALHRFQEKIIGAWEADGGDMKDKYGFYQILTMASMLEMEAQRQSELPIIASVFYNRLSRGMPLASDPTVLYAMGLMTKAVVTYSDVAIDSPYNTYRQKGFPPTPISSPGLAAFRAALHPGHSGYLFFVADGQGGHHFTQTYQQHLAAQRGSVGK